VLALLAALVLIVGAVLVRGLLDDDDGGTDVVGTDTTSVPAPSGAIICIEELAFACAGIEGSSVEAAGDTIDRLSTDESAEPLSAWVTFAPLPQIIDENRTRSGLGRLFATTTLVGRSPLVFVMQKVRGDALAAHCGGDVTWTCVGDGAGRPWSEVGGEEAWGELKPSHEAPDRTAKGTLVFAWAVASWFGTPDGLSTSSLRSNDDFIGWATRLERAIPSGSTLQTPLEEMVINPAKYDVVATTEAEALPLAGPNAPRGSGFSILYPSPMGEALAVVAEVGAGRPERNQTISAELVAAEWKPASGEAPANIPGLPSPGVIEALRTSIWPEVS